MGLRKIVVSISCLVFVTIFHFGNVLEKLRSANSSSPAAPLPPVHIDSSWIGNQWMPPVGYQLYNAREMQAYFQRHSILFVGDSTARRSYATLFAILNSTEHPDNISVHDLNDASVIDINKKETETPCDKEEINICRKMPFHAFNQLDFAKASCLIKLGNWATNNSSPLWSNWVHEYSLIIFVLGPWEVDDKWQCGSKTNGRKNQTDIFFKNLFQADDTLRGGSDATSFIWRTWGSPATKEEDLIRDKKMWSRARAHNSYVKALVDKHNFSRINAGKEMGRVSYLDWEHVMRPRLYPHKNRIAGDIPPHYGLEARLAFMQMLMNQLVEKDRQKALKIHPSQRIDYMDDHGDNDPENFMTTSKAKNQAEINAYEMAKSSFCDKCNWRDEIKCDYRLTYLQTRYGTDLIEFMGKSPNCNKSAILV